MRRRFDAAPCLRCTQPMSYKKNVQPGTRPYGGHGYCQSCYVCIHQRPTPTVRSGRWNLDDLMAEWDFLRRQGYTLRQAVERLGVTYTALDRALCRAKAAGDPRARRT